MASIVTRTNRVLILLSLLCAIALLGGCSKPAIVDGVLPVEIGGKTFALEIVADNDTRNLGLGGRTEMDADKGMIFSFPDSKLRRFVMRDCYMDIDIIFIDSAGRITAMHHMPTEGDKRDDETQYAYESRLLKYSSRFNAQYAIELVGGMLETLNLEDGQQIKLDVEYLQSVTR